MAEALQLSDSARCLLLIERDIPQAQSMLAEAIQLAGARAPDLANVSWARGLMHGFLGEVDRAVPALEHALDQAARDESRWEEFTCLSNLITVALDGDQPEVALAHCQRLQDAAEKMIGGAEQEMAAALAALARVGTGQAGPEILAPVADRLRVVDAKGTRAYTLNSAPPIQLRAGRLNDARTRAGEALAAASAVGRPTHIPPPPPPLAQAALAYAHPPPPN